MHEAEIVYLAVGLSAVSGSEYMQLPGGLERGIELAGLAALLIRFAFAHETEGWAFYVADQIVQGGLT